MIQGKFELMFEEEAAILAEIEALATYRNSIIC